MSIDEQMSLRCRPSGASRLFRRPCSDLDHRDYMSLNLVMNIPVREFKAKLSRYIRRAREGKDVVITSRGRAVARLIPAAPQAPPETSSRDLLRRLSLIPGIQPGGGGKPTGTARPPLIGRGQKSLSELVLEGRR